MNTLNKVKFGIKLKLFLLVLISTSFVIAIIIWQIDSQSKSIAKETVANSLSQSQVILNTKLESRFNDIEELAKGMSKDGRILPLVFDEASSTLQDLSIELERTLDFQSMFVTNAQGTILARSDRPEAIGRSMAGRSKLFDEPLQGKVTKGFIVSGGEILQMVVVPIFDNVATDLVRGSLSLSYTLSPAIAREINALTKSNVDFYIFNYDENRNISGVDIAFSTYPGFSNQFLKTLNSSAELEKYIALNDASNETLILGKDVYKAAIKPVSKYEGGNLGFIMAYRSETELLQPFREIEKSIFIIGSVCIGIALISAWILALRISTPIIDLVLITSDIENGKYPDNSEVTRNDEIGVLHQALLKMGRGLKDKHELENYLAEIASDIVSDIDDSFVEGAVFELASTDPTNSLDDTLVDPRLATKSSNDELDATVQMHSDNQNEEPISIEIPKVNSTRQIDVVDGRYRLLRMLGKGTTGVAYLAHDKELDEKIAIKILFDEYVTSDFARMFKEEIKLARQITHRNILRTFDFGNSDGIFYITMEYIQGYDLNKLLKLKGKLSPHIAVIMVKQICSALVAAHELGIIHRDLKPENMIINRQGVLKIMDFGLAMKVGTPDSQDSPFEENTTQETTIAGTPRFMAPEQFTGTSLDHRTDIYAVGIILFTLLTGSTPFTARNFLEISKQHQEDAPPLLSDVLKDAPKDLEKIIQKALMKNQTDRFQSITEMLNALNDANY